MSSEFKLSDVDIKNIIVDHLRKWKKETGAQIGNLLRRHDPMFNSIKYGHSSLTKLIYTLVDEVVVIGKSGGDQIWALSDMLDDRDIGQPDSIFINSTVSDNENDCIDWIELDWFRSCKKMHIDLDDVTLLVGANGAGKTSILRGIFYACQLNQGRPLALFSGPRDLSKIRHLKSQGDTRFALHASSGAELSLEGKIVSDFPEFRLTFNRKKSWEFPLYKKSPPGISPVQHVSWPVQFLQLRSDALADSCPIEEEKPQVDFDGYKLASTLAWLATNEPERLELIVSNIRNIIPQLKRLRMPLKEDKIISMEDQKVIDKKYKYTLEAEMEGAGWVSAEMLSEGTLFLLGIHTVLHQNSPPRILLMDDIDRGLHPKAQRLLIQQLLKIDKKTRIIATTHSPYVLDVIPPAQVRIVRSTPETGTVCRRLTDHPDWKEWEGSMNAVEFWTYVGEDWLESTP